MTQETERPTGYIFPPDPQSKTKEARESLAQDYDDLRERILEEVKSGDPYWTKPQILEDGEIGPPRNWCSVLGTLERMADKLREADNQPET